MKSAEAITSQVSILKERANDEEDPRRFEDFDIAIAALEWVLGKRFTVMDPLDYIVAGHQEPVAP